MGEPHPTPVDYAKLVRTLIWISPFGGLLAFGLAAVQGADIWLCLLLAGIMVVGCLAAALLFHVRGAAAESDAKWIVALLRLFSRR